MKMEKDARLLLESALYALEGTKGPCLLEVHSKSHCFSKCA